MSDNIQYLTLGQAAKVTGKSKSTIFKAIKNGTLSFVEQTSAGYKLNPDEVFLVFPPNDSSVSHDARSRTFQVSTETTENDYLKRENELLRKQIEREREQSDYWRAQATALLTHQTEPGPEPAQETNQQNISPVNSRLWVKLFGRTDPQS